jgi:hypothetical protein
VSSSSGRKKCICRLNAPAAEEETGLCHGGILQDETRSRGSSSGGTIAGVAGLISLRQHVMSLTHGSGAPTTLPSLNTTIGIIPHCFRPSLCQLNPKITVCRCLSRRWQGRAVCFKINCSNKTSHMQVYASIFCIDIWPKTDFMYRFMCRL